MFASNVQPRRIIKEVKAWFCHTCNADIKAYFNKCPTCGGHRNS